MASNETTAKLRVDVSDLKKGIQEANRQIRLANAEFKAASSSMEQWEKSTQGVTAKVQSLERILSAQNSVLSNYKEQLQRIVEAEGENSKGADEMRIKIANQQAAVNKTAKELEQYKDTLNQLEKEQEDSAKATEEQKSAYEKLNDTMDEQEKELEELKRAYADAVFRGAKDEADELGREIEQLSTELKSNKDAMREAESAADEFDKSLDDIDPEKSASGFTVLKGALADLVAYGIREAIQAIKDFAKAVLEVGMSFDSEMSKVGAISGATTEEMEMLRDKAKEMGSTTKFTATQAGEAFEYMAMAGWKTEDMLSGIDGILNLAAASGEDLGTTSDIVTDALTAFGYSAEDAGHFADVLAAASSNANTNVSMMGESFKYVAPLAGAMGYSAEDVAIALGLMANSGIKSTQAGTSLRNMLTRMVDPTDDVQQAMDRLGISIEDENGNMYSLYEIMEQLRGGFGDLMIPQEEFTRQCEELDQALEDGTITQKEYDKQLEELTNLAFGAEEAQKAQAAATLGGARALSGLLAISEASDEDFQALTDSIYGCEGAAETMATTMQDNLGGDMTKLKSKLEGIQLELYEKLEPALRKGADALSGFLDFIDWIVDHSDGFVTALEAMGVALGTYLAYTTAIKVMEGGWAALTIVTKAQAAAQALLNGVMSLNPIGVLVAAIAGLIVVITALWKKSEKFREFVKTTWEVIKLAITTAAKAIKEALEKAWNGIKKAWEGAKQFFTGLFNTVKQVASDVATAIGDFFNGCWEAIKTAWNAVVGFFEGIFNAIKTAVQTTVTIVTGLFVGAWEAIKLVWSAVTGFFQGIWNGISGAFGAVITFFKNIFSRAWEGIKEIWGTVAGWFEGVVGKITGAFTNIWQTIGDAFKKVYEKIKEWIEKAVNFVKGAAKTIKDALSVKGSIDVSKYEKGGGSVNLRAHAVGGVVEKGEIALLEGTGAEAVVPLDRNEKWIKATAKALKQSLSAENLLGAGGTIGVGGSTVNYNFVQNNTSPKALSRLEIYRMTQNQLAFAQQGGMA